VTQFGDARMILVHSTMSSKLALEIFFDATIVYFFYRFTLSSFFVSRGEGGVWRFWEAPSCNTNPYEPSGTSK
jgi:hypothetical protein